MTADSVLNRFEGKHPEHPGKLCNTSKNFNCVTKGGRSAGQYTDASWLDGFVYGAIRGAADSVTRRLDIALEKRVDGYIGRIAKAQVSELNGYINAYAQLIEADH